MTSFKFSKHFKFSNQDQRKFSRMLATALLAAICAFSAATQTADSKTTGKMTEKDRKFALDQLKASREKFVKSVAGLSEAQLKFKATPERWSIAEVAEHITLAEDFLFNLITNNFLKTPATPDKERKVTDESVLALVKDRSNKAQAPEPAKPTGKWSNVADTMKEFEKRRANTVDFVKTTTADLRSHFAPFANGNEIDGLQWILVLSSHTERHTAQIEEVKADPNFPKK